MPHSQQLPPAQPPEKIPAADSQSPSLRVTTTEVLVPTLVEKKGGGILYGLKPGDFILDDNGVPQKIRVQEELDTAPVNSTSWPSWGRCLMSSLAIRAAGWRWLASTQRST